MKFSKEFYGCADGDIYPKMFAAGDECPDELLESATELGVVEAPKGKGKEKEPVEKDEKESHGKSSKK